MSINNPAVLILGIGNLLWADEGFGVRAACELMKTYRFQGNITVMDGGTQGIYLIEPVTQAELLIVFDAIDYGLPAGELKEIHGEDVPKFLGAKKMSLHQTGFQEVLAMAEMLGRYPKHLLLIGVQPVELEDYGGSLHPLVKAQIQPAIGIALDYLADFGITATLLEQHQEPALVDPILDINRYENERPSVETACRSGDERVIYSADFKLIPPGGETGAIAIPVDFRGKY